MKTERRLTVANNLVERKGNNMKCVYCGGKTKKGIHDLCWVVLKRYVLANPDGCRAEVNTLDEVEQEAGATYIDRAGRHIVQGRVVVPINPDDIE